MAILSFIHGNGIWISIPAFVLFASLLALCIVGVIRTVRQARLFSVPLLAQQDIEFSEAGRVVLSLEGPLLSRRFADLEYELIGPDGISVKARRALFRATTSGLKKARMELKVYEIASPGHHVFQVQGLEGERPSDTEHRVVFMLPHVARVVAYVIGILLAGGGAVGSIVLFFLRRASVGNGP